MEVQRMKDKETVRQQFEEIETAFEGMMRSHANGEKMGPQMHCQLLWLPRRLAGH